MKNISMAVTAANSCAIRRSTFLSSDFQVGVAPQVVKFRAKSFGGIRMCLFKDLSKFVQSFRDKVFGKFEDSKLMHDCAIIEIKEDIEKMTKLQLKAIISQIKMEKEYENALQASLKWRDRARLAHRRGYKVLAVAAMKKSDSFLADAALVKIKVNARKKAVDYIKTNKERLIVKLKELKEITDVKSIMNAVAESQRIMDEISQRFENEDEET